VNIRNRIVATAVVDPSTLRAHPKNARRHPSRQRRALASAIDTVGVIQDVIVNRRTGLILDGHLRVDLAVAEKQTQLPVKYVDLDEAEEALVLATFDPIGALAHLDMEEMATLREELAPSLDKPLADLIAELAPAPARTKPSGDDRQPLDDEDADDEGYSNDGPEPEDNTALGFTLTLPSRSIPLTPAEFRDLTNAFFAHLEATGMSFGFVRWLLA